MSRSPRSRWSIGNHPRPKPPKEYPYLYKGENGEEAKPKARKAGKVAIGEGLGAKPIQQEPPLTPDEIEALNVGDTPEEIDQNLPNYERDFRKAMEEGRTREEAIESLMED